MDDIFGWNLKTNSNGPWYEYDILSYAPSQDKVYGVLMPRKLDGTIRPASWRVLLVVLNNSPTASCYKYNVFGMTFRKDTGSGYYYVPLLYHPSVNDEKTWIYFNRITDATKPEMVGSNNHHIVRYDFPYEFKCTGYHVK